MYVDTSILRRNGKTYTRHLLRQSYREGGKVKHRTIANLGRCSAEEIEAIRLALRHKNDLKKLRAAGGTVELGQGPSIGAVWLVHHLAGELGIAGALGDDREGRLALMQVIARVIDQGSRLSAIRLARDHAMCEVLGLARLDEDDLYENLDWLNAHQAEIEDRLFAIRKGGAGGGLFLYDVTSSYFEGTQNELAGWGYNRDGKRGKRQIVIGLLCDRSGVPLSIEVFPGNTQDLATFSAQVRKVAARFGSPEITFVGDRGMIKSPQIQDLGEHGFHYITAITKPQIETLLAAGVLQMDLFDKALAEVKTDDGLRYVLRRNPARAAEVAATRRDKVRALERLAKKENRYLSEHPRAKARTALRRLEERARKLGIAAFLELAAEGREVTFGIDREALAEKVKLDGCYALKTDLPKKAANKEVVHDRYKDLALVEWAFRDAKTVHLEMRPIFLRREGRTRGHAFVVMLAYLLIRELRARWRSLDITVQEGINRLASLCLTEVRLRGRVPYYQVPEPRKALREMFEAAEVPLPKALVPASGNVTTKRKLTERRKRK